ncbi:Phosphoprotein phosphatase, putative [Theobroma cacao]|uniref:Phosphoprotein phosphatase, putative n=1 Tax=Theobroma cacao TaxID=3641 RepID=A0A061FPT5_THECC|nr:Phosphoprotein phosphatase, putative [Theobroma cacao]
MTLGCPKMKIFSEGDLSTPMLQRVQFVESEDEACSEDEGDLRTPMLRRVQFVESEDGACWILWVRAYYTLRAFRVDGAMEKESSRNYRLQKLILESCADMASFYQGSKILEFLSLKRVNVVGCPQMFAFASTVSKEQRIEATDDGGNTRRLSKGVADKVFFNNTVLCPNLAILKLSSTKVHSIWSDQVQVTSSNVLNLRTMRVSGCHNLKHLFPSFLIKSFVQLNHLMIHDCKNMEEVIYTDGLAQAEGIMLLPNLERLWLGQLPKLTRFCYGDNSESDGLALFNEKTVFPRLNDLRIGMGNWRKIWDDKVTMNSFCELQFLLVRDCERLSNIFPFYMMERLEKLEILQIMNCDSLEEILGPQGLNSNQSHSVATTELINDKAVTKFVFPKVRSLVLSKLSKLKSFYSKMHTTEWPCLKELEVIECNKLEISAEEYLNIRETQGESQLSTQYFGKVKAFGLMSFRNKSVAISNCFIQSFPHLEKLVVGEAFFNEIFQFEGLGGDEGHAGVLARLSELSLLELPELTHPRKEEIPLGEEVLNNLRILAVLRCGKSKNLMPCSASFKNLTTLEISKRHGFMNLVTLPTAKSMVLLTRMSLTDCQMLERIIASTSNEVMDAIIFSKLESLELDGLPSLSRFCSGNYTFEFPSLKEVIMRRCPKMEIFSKGELSTPKLRGIKSTEGEYVGHWEGNLNATVQQLFIEKVFPSMEDLELSLINIQRILHYKLLAQHSYAQNLTCLTMEGCHNLNSLFPSSTVESFVQLKMLNIENCENVEKEILIEGLANEEMIRQWLFRRLEFLLLKDLPKLTRFCHGNYLEFPLLRTLRIESCPTLKTFISDAEGNSSEIASPTLFNEKAAHIEEFLL